MTAPEGAFYSAEDADSVIDPANPHEKGEGAFYIWSAEEPRSSDGIGGKRRRRDIFASAISECAKAATWRKIRTANSPAATFYIGLSQTPWHSSR